MTPHAAKIKAQRAKRAAEVAKRVDEEFRQQVEQSRRDAQQWQRRQQTPEEIAQAILKALDSNEDAAHDLAAQLLKNAPEDLRAKVYELAGVNSQFKQRRSRKTNGY